MSARTLTWKQSTVHPLGINLWITLPTKESVIRAFVRQTDDSTWVSSLASAPVFITKEDAMAWTETVVQLENS
jgi:hypothetical protein